MEEYTINMNEVLKVVGIHPVKEAINSGKEIEKILVSRETSNSELSDIVKQAKEKGIPVQKVPKIKLDKTSDINHQGILAYISPIKFAEIDDILDVAASRNESPFVIILDSVTDTRNFGAICRTAECMGVHGIIIPKNHSAPINEGVIKSSAGAVLKLKISRINHLQDAIYHLQASEIKVVSFTEKAESTLRDFAPLKGGVAIILGSEELGINPKLIASSDNHLKIQMYGSTESLNVGVAAGIAIYEVKNKLDQ